MKKDLPKFIGRASELQTLRQLSTKNIASLVVVRGRRRIGKSRLIEEFAKGSLFFSFAGLAPTPTTTAQSQLDTFSQQLSEQTGLPEVKADNWSKLFLLLSEKIRTKKIVLLFDEISWMGSKAPDFLGQIKHAWDTRFKKNPKLTFIICGSASAWIEENILSSTAFLGRVSYTLVLDELPLKDCSKFWPKKIKNISNYEKLKLLAITGGVPRYLEEINPRISAEENITSLCFKPGSILANEFDHIFSNVFKRQTPLYREIVKLLSGGSKETTEISKALDVDITGLLSEYLEELILSGYLKRDYTWNIQKGIDSKLSKYRLSDNYLRFYLRYIAKFKNKIEQGSFDQHLVSSLPGWNTMLGLQFENLVLNNRHYVIDSLHLSRADIINDNPFFQRQNTKQPGCQIDYMIQTKFETLYICEIKFSKKPIGTSVIQEVQQKIDNLKRPKGHSCRAVLIHANGVTDELLESGYFSSIIDFTKALD